METIKNYLEAMFASMPSTPEVWRAKNELYQMMEDKYSELIAEGKSENEAIGEVISNFGNLDELAEDLGIQKEMQAIPEVNRRMLTFDEVKEYINARNRKTFFVSLGVMLCILSVVGPIMTDALHILDAIGVCILMILIVVAVAMFIYAGGILKPWEFLRKESCTINFETMNYIKAEQNRSRGVQAVQKTIGIILCIVCWMPAMILDAAENALHLSENWWVIDVTEGIEGTLLFVFVAIGVFLIVNSNMHASTFEKLLSLNDKSTVSGSYANSEGEMEYINPTIATIMSVFWPTVTCIYLAWSFLTFTWWSTWIIWPIAAIIHSVIEKNLKQKK